MPFVTCPTCSTSISHQFADTSARCEKCAVDVAIPVFDPGPPPPRSAPISVEPIPQKRSPRYDDDDDDLLAAAQSRRSREGHAISSRPVAAASDFATCRTFLRVASVGAWLFVFLWVGMAAFSFLVVRQMSQAELRSSANMLLLTIWGLGGGMLLGIIVHFVGQIGCCATPSPYHKPAARCMIYFGIAFVAALGYLTTWWMLESSGRNALPLFVAWLISVLMLAVSAPISYYSWMKYLHGMAKRFGGDGLATQVHACLGMTLAAIALPLVVGLIVGIYFPQVLPHLNLNIVFGLMYLFLSIWYAIILGALATRVGRAVSGER